MQISEPKVAIFGSPTCPALARRRPRGTHTQAAESTVDDVLTELLGDFDRLIPLDSDSSKASNGVASSSEQAQKISDEADKGVHVAEPVLAPTAACQATWRPTASHCSSLLSVRAGAGCATFHAGEHAQFTKQHPCPETAPKFVAPLFPDSSYAREQTAGYRASALLCAARFHDDLFGTQVLDPAFDMLPQMSLLGQQPRNTVVGSIHLRRGLQSLQVGTRLLTLHHAEVDTRSWTASEDLFCLDDDPKILQPVTQHLRSCWSGNQVLSSLAFSFSGVHIRGDKCACSVRLVPASALLKHIYCSHVDSPYSCFNDVPT